MAKPGEKPSAAGLEVRGQVDVEKFKAARALSGDQVTFELRAVNPSRSVGTDLRINCVVCLICVICVVCAAAKADELGIGDLKPLSV